MSASDAQLRLGSIEEYQLLYQNLERELREQRAVLKQKDRDISILRKDIWSKASELQNAELLLQSAQLSESTGPPSRFVREAAGVADEVPEEAGDADHANGDWRSSQRIAAALQHQNGTCSPCTYFRSQVGCCLGLSCSFCHEHHEGDQRATEHAWPRPPAGQRTGQTSRGKDRPPKPIRDKCKALAREIMASTQDLAVAEERLIEQLLGSDPVTLHFAQSVLRAFVMSPEQAEIKGDTLAPEAPPQVPRFATSCGEDMQGQPCASAWTGMSPGSTLDAEMLASGSDMVHTHSIE